MARPELNLDDIPDLMDLTEASNLTHISVRTLRREIHNKALDAFILRGRAPLRAGRGQGYRITRDALTRWYFNSPSPAVEK